MSKMNYEKINWEANTNWGFYGSYENLREAQNRLWEYVGIKVSIEEFGYKIPYKGLAFKKGDIVKYTPTDGEPTLGVVDAPVGENGWFVIRLASGRTKKIHPNGLGKQVVTAGIPEELMALARAEAATASVDLSKCPLKKAGACMETE